MTGKLLGIDHGNKRIGIALSDAMQIVAHEHLILHRISNEADFQQIRQIVTDERVIAVVVGVPYSEANVDDPNAQANIVQNWIAELRQIIDVPIIVWDEQFTSADARTLARQKKRKPDEPIDDLAARLILQSYLDALHDGLATPPLQTD